MCGIAGAVGFGPQDESRLRAVANAMRHRGPDDEGVWLDGHAGLAFRRLAILDLDRRGNQPMHLGRQHLVFNGEIYNYRELREELRAHGRTFATEGDSEVLLHAWNEWGAGALDRLNGMFAFAVWDDAERALTLAVDPFGEKPLLYAQRDARLAFASDARALRLALDEPLEPDGPSVRRFVGLGVMPDVDSTFFARIRRLPAGCWARWRDGQLTVRRYWEPRRVDVPNDPEDAAHELRGLLTDSIRLRLRADVPIGTSLSGGVDSSGVVGLSAELAGDHRRHAFTARFPGFDRDEWAYASQSAREAGVVEHHAVEPTATTLLEDLPRLADDQEEPFASLSIYAQWCVMRATSQAGITVLLDGQGADELFGGYRGSTGLALRSMPTTAALRVLRRRPDLRREWLRSLLAGRLPPVAERAYYRGLASPYLRANVREEVTTWRPPEIAFGTLAGTPMRRELIRQAFGTSLPQLLRYADRNSMAHSREIRLPFLDRRIADFAFSLPATTLATNGVSKSVLRDALRGSVPRAILARRDKVGFEPPQAMWMADARVINLAADVLLDRDALTRDVLDRTVLEADVRAGGWRSHEALWRAVSVELWAQRVCGSPSTPPHVDAPMRSALPSAQ